MYEFKGTWEYVTKVGYLNVFKGNCWFIGFYALVGIKPLILHMGKHLFTIELQSQPWKDSYLCSLYS